MEEYDILGYSWALDWLSDLILPAIAEKRDGIYGNVGSISRMLGVFGEMDILPGSVRGGIL